MGGDAESLLPGERKRRRETHEDEKWDEEYYLWVFSLSFVPTLLIIGSADFVNDEEIRELILWVNPLLVFPPGDEIHFTESERATMLRLPRRERSYDLVSLSSISLTTAS